MNRVAVVGLDGVSWGILKEIFTRKVMPTLQQMSERAIRGVLESTIPPFTPTAWTSIATGVNPGKHGIYDFLYFTPSYEVKIHTSNDVKYPRVHEMAGIKGVKSICINQPLTYPIIPVKNVAVISDWLSPKQSYFPSWMSEYASIYAPYRISSETIYVDELLKGLLKECELRIKSLTMMAENVDWQLFWVIFSEPDILMHRCYNRVLMGEKTVDEIFGMIDEFIKVLFKYADNIVVVSDHGFSEYRRVVNVNTILYNMGLVEKTIKKVPGLVDLRLKAKVKKVRIPTWLYNIVSIRPIKRVIKTLYRVITGYDLKAEPYMYVDMAESKAYMASSSSFGVIVKEADLIPEIIDKLKATGFFSGIWKREEIYEGPYVAHAPDIMFLPNYDEGYDNGGIYISDKIVENRNTYDHHPDGIFMIYPHDSEWIGKIRAVDVAPTVLNLLNLPVPLDSDGTSLIGKDTGRFDYLGKWKLLRRIMGVKAKYLS